MRRTYVELSGRSGESWMAATGTEHSVTTVHFQEADFHWPLFGNEFEEVTVASVPSTAFRIFRINDSSAAVSAIWNSWRSNMFLESSLSEGGSPRGCSYA